jgi:NADPH-dependent 2,4-dienoyl-CoA reductase/sulfur reductase-like enzyme
VDSLGREDGSKRRKTMAPAAVDSPIMEMDGVGTHALPSGDPRSVLVVGAGPAGLMLA